MSFWNKKSKNQDVNEVVAAIAMALRENEIIAAISMALCDSVKDDLHDNESCILTIKRSQNIYSPWNLKSNMIKNYF
ncbi:MAG: hypothetical protein LBR17_02165 [Bacteroidales bacterium]|jgi:hypothetical protein|nr:hypothetical protein [Bacteroidales bacterium]